MAPATLTPPFTVRKPSHYSQISVSILFSSCFTSSSAFSRLSVWLLASDSMASVEEVPPVVPVAEAAVSDEKSGKGKKGKAAGKEPKAKKPKSAAKAPKQAVSHPSYGEMIKEAIISLKEKKGSSLHAITKSVEQKHSSVLPAHFKKLLLSQLKKLVHQGKITQVKGHFKLAIEIMKPSLPKPKVVAKPKPSTKAKSPAKSKAVKAKTVKKVISAKPKSVKASKPANAVKSPKKTVVSAKAKKPKTIKSPRKGLARKTK